MLSVIVFLIVVILVVALITAVVAVFLLVFFVVVIDFIDIDLLAAALVDALSFLVFLAAFKLGKVYFSDNLQACRLVFLVFAGSGFLEFMLGFQLCLVCFRVEILLATIALFQV